jgi:hypothetical protein
MKILLLGPVDSGQTSLMRMRAFEHLGHTVRGVHTVEPWTQASWLKRQTQRRLQRGSIVEQINRSVIENVREFRPDLMWAEKQEFLRVETIEEVRRLGMSAVHFTPDQYFSLDWALDSYLSEWPEFGNTFPELKDLAAAAGCRIRYLDQDTEIGEQAAYGTVLLERIPDEVSPQTDEPFA